MSLPPPSAELPARKNLKYNVGVNLLDAAFFGFGLGFSSSTIITLFVKQMTDSAILIGLIPAIHAVGWQLPQLFTANTVAKLKRFKPMVMWMTIHERIPYVLLILAAWLAASGRGKLALTLTFILLIWQGLGAGFAANPWQSMIAKIIPGNSRGTFFGLQAAIANVLMSGAAIAAGYTLDRFDSPLDFILCFVIAGAGYGISMLFLGLTREEPSPSPATPLPQTSLFNGMGAILRRDANFRWFLAVRFLYQFATMSFAFYVVYGLKKFGLTEITAGYLTATLTITQTVANALMGWLGDKVGHRAMLILGILSAIASSLMAWAAPNLNWFYPIFITFGLANVAYWTIGIAMSVEFGSEAERPIYIGMSNTFIAPATIFAPIIGGWIADAFGFQATFIVSAALGVVVTLMLVLLVKDHAEANRT